MKINNDEKIPQEIIASAIIKIADGFERINGTRLTRSAIVTLVASRTRVAKDDIEKVLNALENMEKDWLKPVEKKK